MPAQFGAARVDALDSFAPDVGKAGFRRLDRRLIDPDGAYAELVHLGEQRIRRVLVHIHHAAAARDTDFAHGIEHARVVAAVGAWLHEHEALDAKMPGELEVIRQRRERRNIAQILVHPAMWVAVGRAEHVEMRVAG